MIASAGDKRTSPQSRNAPERQASTLNSTDAMAMVEHGSEVTLNVTTPVGTSSSPPAHLWAVILTIPR